jgi:myo-inositol-1-phosphate synthase
MTAGVSTIGLTSHPPTDPIRVAIAGVGNCASSLVQGVAHYRRPGADAVGLMRERVGPYGPGDIRSVAAVDIDARKVGRTLHDAIFAPPNNTARFADESALAASARNSPLVLMAPVLDGLPDHMVGYPEHQRFVTAGAAPVDLAAALRASGAQVLVNYLPVGAQQATEAFAQACLDAGLAMVNCIPVFLASHADWAERFRAHGLPIVGDDIKAQVGATITHRTLVRLLAERGVRVDRTYQLNTGGNTDFLNMLNRTRLTHKKQSKTEAVTSQLGASIDPDNVHIGPSDFVPWQKDNKVCFLRIEGTGFGGVPMNLELRLSVEDSPNSAAVVLDALRLCRLALDRRLAGPIDPACAWCMKHPPVQRTDRDAHDAVEAFIAGRPTGF